MAKVSPTVPQAGQRVLPTWSNGWALCPAWFPKVLQAVQHVTYIAVRARPDRKVYNMPACPSRARPNLGGSSRRPAPVHTHTRTHAHAPTHAPARAPGTTLLDNPRRRHLSPQASPRGPNPAPRPAPQPGRAKANWLKTCAHQFTDNAINVACCVGSGCTPCASGAQSRHPEVAWSLKGASCAIEDGAATSAT